MSTTEAVLTENAAAAREVDTDGGRRRTMPADHPPSANAWAPGAGDATRRGGVAASGA